MAFPQRGTFLTQVPVQCQEPQEMTEGNSRNAVPGKAQDARKSTHAQHNPDQVGRHRSGDARDAALQPRSEPKARPSELNGDPSYDTTLSQSRYEAEFAPSGIQLV